jgi:predicted RNA binding protein YcfA (HicA-like mRNA interferase family)
VIVPISGKELAKLFKKQGYEEVKRGGKGSHMKLRKGNKTVIIPGHKELKKGLEMALRKQLEGDK